MTDRDDDRDELDDVTRIVARANESLDEVLRITGGARPEPPAAPASPDEDLADEQTRLVDRAPAPAESVDERAQRASDATMTPSLDGSPASFARPDAASADALDEATRIVDRAAAAADRADLVSRAADAAPTGDASTEQATDAASASAWDEATRIVDRAPAPAESVEQRAQPGSDATVTPALDGSPASAARPDAASADALDEATRIVDRAPAAEESTRLVTRPATRAERRAEDLRRANELEDSTRIVARPESAEERAARELAARLAVRAENPHNDGPVDDATQLAIRPPEPIVDPEPPARAILPPKTRVLSNTQTATFEQTGDERWPTGGAPRIAPLPSPAGEDEGDGPGAQRPRLIDGLPARLQTARWERETELRVVDTAQLHREARAQRRRQAATVVSVIAVVVVGSAAGLAALLLTSF